MTTPTPRDRQRHQLIANVLAVAADRGLPVVIAAALDRLVRVYDPATDHPVLVPLRALRADHVRCD